MTNKEKIKAEIERLKESGCASPIVICDTLLAFIDSLPEEYKLTLQDIKRVILLEHHVIADDRCHHKLMTQEDLCKEILKRINNEQTS